jgi:excisionase family DNA binding protein
MSGENGRYMPLSAVSVYVHLSEKTLYSKVCKREIPYVKAGGRLLFDKEEIDKWIVHVPAINEK